MTRSNSNTSRAGSESVLQGLINQSSSGDHHKLLLSAFDQFDRHFSQDQAETPESIELVKRMVTLISSTTKLNNGLRALTEAIKEEQVQAQLDEGQRNPTISITQFEKSINALLRSSDDQVRNLSEDLIAFTRVERERDRIRKDPETLSRPVSRAGGSSHKPLPLASPPKRPTTASSLEGATVSLSSSRSPVVSREILRNPLEDPNDSLPPRRSTLHFGGRSPFAATDSPSPASRRDLTSQRSPLASETNFETPSRRQSISTSSTFSSGTGGSGGRPSNRRAKYSVSLLDSFSFSCFRDTLLNSRLEYRILLARRRRVVLSPSLRLHTLLPSLKSTRLPPSLVNLLLESPLLSQNDPLKDKLEPIPVHQPTPSPSKHSRWPPTSMKQEAEKNEQQHSTDWSNLEPTLPPRADQSFRPLLVNQSDLVLDQVWEL